MAATALGIARAPALLAFQELRSLGEAWPALGRLVWLGTSPGLSFFVFGFALLLVVPVSVYLPRAHRPPHPDLARDAQDG